MAMKTFLDNTTLPASDINEYLVNTKYAEKPSATTRISTTTPANDPDLQIPVDSNKTYRLDLVAPLTSAAAAGFKFSFAVPAGAVFTGYALTGVGGVVSVITYSSAGNAITINVPMSSSGGGVDDLVTVSGTLDTAGNAGTVIYQWAQQTSNGGNTTVRAGASMLLRRVA